VTKRKRETHEIHKVREVKVIRPYLLRLRYEDGKVNEVDLKDILYGKIFGPPRNPDFFRQVRIDPEVPTIVWPNGADFDPETLYYWDEYMPAFKEMAERWREKEQLVAIVERA